MRKINATCAKRPIVGVDSSVESLASPGGSSSVLTPSRSTRMRSRLGRRESERGDGGETPPLSVLKDRKPASFPGGLRAAAPLDPFDPPLSYDIGKSGLPL